ncbi:ATPase (AAA+ superfamily) [Candidatus Magnetomorum sp. HK-1]|nr:ATPase (AAA+ superfamily) [Candidatus Magnetomorum sp. HK-1]
MEFIGRKKELELLKTWDKKSSRLTVIYGRRRVGKTRLVEEYASNEIIYKFEGLEGQSKREQLKSFLLQLSLNFNKFEIQKPGSQNWDNLFLLLSNYLGSDPCVVFFDEFQWMAGDRNELVSRLKFAWDNIFSKKNKIHMVLCGSISSFMVKNVLRSKALYGRVDAEINLGPLFLPAITNAFSHKRSLRELIELYMVVGGVPQYLKMLDFSKSIFLNLKNLCFSSNGYLVNELDRILISHFGKNTTYRNIIIYLSKNNWGDRKHLEKFCQIKSGGRFSLYLDNLELAGFIEKYVSVDKPTGVKNARYRIIDPYLLFYFNFIYPHLRKINQQEDSFPITHFLPDKKYFSWQGIAFERVCYRHNRLIAEKLGFGAVQYDVGSWFQKGADNIKSQIDLIFIRADGVLTLCEIKFTRNKIGKEVIKDIERKIEILPNPKQLSIEKVLITAAKPTEPLEQEGYFHNILTIDNIFS